MSNLHYTWLQVSVTVIQVLAIKLYKTNMIEQKFRLSNSKWWLCIKWWQINISFLTLGTKNIIKSGTWHASLLFTKTFIQIKWKWVGLVSIKITIWKLDYKCTQAFFTIHFMSKCRYQWYSFPDKCFNSHVWYLLLLS